MEMEVRVILQRVKVTRRTSKEVLTQDYNFIVVPISKFSFYQRQSQQHSTNEQMDWGYLKFQCFNL